MNGIRLAVGTLTAVPVRPPTRVDSRVARTAMLVAPAVGAALGAFAAGVVAAAHWLGLSAWVAAGIAVAALALATRGLHLDGLADTADGLAASVRPGRSLDVMRRGDVGPAGVATLVLVLLLQVGGLAACVDAGHGPLAAAVAVVAGRAVLPMACTRPIPPAREDGLGVAVAGSVPVAAAAGVAVVVLLVCALAASATGLAPGVAVAAVAAGWAAAALLLTRCVRLLGGVTGDVLGGIVEVAVTAALVVLSAG